MCRSSEVRQPKINSIDLPRDNFYTTEKTLDSYGYCLCPFTQGWSGGRNRYCQYPNSASVLHPFREQEETTGKATQPPGVLN